MSRLLCRLVLGLAVTAAFPALAQINSNDTTDGLVIRTQGTERMRITSSGVIAVGAPMAGFSYQMTVSASGLASVTGAVNADGTSEPGVTGYSTGHYGTIGRSRNDSVYGGVIGYHPTDNIYGYGILGNPSWAIYAIGRQVDGTGGVRGNAGSDSVYGLLGYRASGGTEYSVYGAGAVYIGSSNNAVPAIYGYHGGSNFGVRGYGANTYGAYFQSGSSYGVYASAIGGSAGQISARGNANVSTNNGFLGNNTAWGYYCYIAHRDNYSIICSGPESGTSDARLKKDFTPLKQSEGLAALMRIKPTYYRWKEPKKNSMDRLPEMGFSAQNVEKVLPALVGTVSQTDNLEIPLPGGTQKVLNYERMIAPLILAIQQLKTENDSIRARIQKLKASRS